MTNYKYSLLYLILFFSGCNLIFEDDLSTKKVDMLSPPIGYTTYTQTQTFVWDSLPDITQYRFQLVSKRFDFIEEYTIDTFLTTTSITLALQPKEYEWRVSAYNNSSQTDYHTFNLTVVQDTTLVNQIVNTIVPAANASYSSDSVAFWWSALGLADQYQLQVATNPSFNSQTIVVDSNTVNDYIYLIDQLGLGTFYWRLRAMRVGIDSTAYSAIQQFSIDMAPVHQNPANSSTQTLPLNMSWNSASNLAKDSLFLYFNNTATAYKTVEITTGNYTFDAIDTTGYGAGTYYWNLRSVGNNSVLSSYSSLWQFTIN